MRGRGARAADARTAVPGLVDEVRTAGGRVVVTDHHGQVAALAPSAQWHVAGGTVVPRGPAAVEDDVVVEVSVAAAAADGLLADLRARGLDPRRRQ